MILASFAKMKPLPIMFAGLLPQFRNTHTFVLSIEWNKCSYVGQNREEDDLSNLAARKNLYPAPYDNLQYRNLRFGIQKQRTLCLYIRSNYWNVSPF